jgi:hypothetical protein
LTYIACSVSVVVAAAWWLFTVGQNAVFFPSFFEYDLFDSLVVLSIGSLLGIILNIVAGRRGGINGRLCLLAGLVLVSPVVYVALLQPTWNILHSGL